MVSDSLIPARPSFMCFFKQSNVERTNSSKKIFDIYVFMTCFIFLQGVVLGIDLRKDLCMRRVLKCTSAYDRV